MPLIGEPISDMHRAAGMQIIEIGIQRPAKNRKGQDITLADFALHIQCPWRIELNDHCIVTDQDFGPDGARRDERAHEFYQGLSDPGYIITSIIADETGGVVIRTAVGFELRIMPDTAGRAADPDPDGWDEYWRTVPRIEGRKHFVVTLSGISRE